jgi:hypothetical protein
VELDPVIRANAVGDTWMPNEQGADAAGTYTAAATLTTAGRNVDPMAGASVVVQ